MIETQPVRVIVFFGSKVLFVGRALNGHVCIPDLKLVQLMSTKLPDAADPPHSATGAGCDQSEG